jgi:hypothetical protein
MHPRGDSRYERPVCPALCAQLCVPSASTTAMATTDVIFSSVLLPQLPKDKV